MFMPQRRIKEEDLPTPAEKLDILKMSIERLAAAGNVYIGMVCNTYCQYVKTLDEYYQRLDAGELPIYRGIALSSDDLLRREIITQLICHFELAMHAIARRYAVDFPRCFAPELGELGPMAADGLIAVDERYIRVLPAGRLLIRNVCMVFDRYLREQRAQRFSKVI